MGSYGRFRCQWVNRLKSLLTKIAPFFKKKTVNKNHVFGFRSGSWEWTKMAEWRVFLVAPVFQFLHLFLTCSAKRKTRSPRQEKVSVSPDEKKARNNSEESNNSPDIILDALDMAESVSQKLDCIMQSLEKLNRIESRLDSMASTMANTESNISRLDADVRQLQQES